MAQTSQHSYRIGIDIGGTFTDFVLINDQSGSLHLHKRLTTPHDPAAGALAGIQELLADQQCSLSTVKSIVHGTTLVTNAIIERRGAKTGLLTTRGFRDILEMGREQRYDIYDLFLQYPEPLAPRRWRLEVDERLSSAGEVLRVPDLAQVRQTASDLVAQGIEALAICFLHAYRNPRHERTVAQMIRQEFPQLAVSVSAEVAPEIREFERTATTVANAYVQPMMDRYLARLEGALQAAGFTGHFLLMQSSGGTATPATARRFPIRLLESGPAAGALVSQFFGQSVGLPDLLSFDMGGTTAKACLLLEGRPEIAPLMEAGRVHRFKRGSGIPIRAPVVEMIEIGAGGGSLARVDRLGLLKVGPSSAGADPGPACYGLGNDEPTVTDACLLLGYYDPRFFLGGSMPLDRAAAELALQRLGDKLGLSAVATAWGIYQIVCENMAAAARVHIIEKGRDPRRYPLIAFGGAGPAHAVQVARKLGAAAVIVPPYSGVASALGLLLAPIRFDFVRSYPGELATLDWVAINDLYAEMVAQAQQLLGAAGVAPEAITFERRVDLRLTGQFHEISVPLPTGLLEATITPDLVASFEAEYRRLYHSLLPGYQPMALNWWLAAQSATPLLRDPWAGRSPLQSAEAQTATPKGSRLAYFAEAGGFVTTPVFDRAHLPTDRWLAGPVLIEERESTTVVSPGVQVRVEPSGSLRITTIL